MVRRIDGKRQGEEKSAAQVATPVGATPAAGAAPLRQVTVSGDLANNSTTSNLVKTSTYTWYDFLPKFLVFQFMRPANVYFLVICLLQTWNEVTITSGRPTMALPFAFILMVQAIKDIIEDAAKHKADNIQNSRTVNVYDPETKQWVARKWYEVKVGQVLKILNKEYVPADIVVVGSSDQENNGVFINTKSLGEELTSRSARCPMTSSSRSRTTLPSLPRWGARSPARRPLRF